MASATRLFARAATRTGARNAFSVAPRLVFRQGGRRFYSSESPGSKSSQNTVYMAIGAIGAGAFAYWYTQQVSSSRAAALNFKPEFKDYQAVYNEIAKRLEEDDSYDDGSYGPVLVRLAWHCSGTYDKETGTGGSNGATMRFAPESGHGANAGLKAARDFLEPVKGEWREGLSSLVVLGG